jgi:hypothetical protein
MFLVSSDRQSDREVGMRSLARCYAAYHPCAKQQLDTLVLLLVGTMFHETRAETLSGCQCAKEPEQVY